MACKTNDGREAILMVSKVVLHALRETFSGNPLKRFFRRRKENNSGPFFCCCPFFMAARSKSFHTALALWFSWRVKGTLKTF